MYPDNFYSFRNGIPVNNTTVNKWLEKARKNLISGQEEDYYFTGSGDTIVIGFKGLESYRFIVANRSGYSEYVVDRYEDDINEISFLKDDNHEK